jgi:perosamine synthetase
MIPVSEPLLSDRESEYVAACIKTGWISSSGTFIEQFEQQWSRYCGRKYGVSVCNGTVALQAAIAALGLADGDEVIMPTFTIISCASAILYCGGTPVLVDADPRTWTMDVSQVAVKITPRTKAIMVVHIYGHPVDMDPIMALADRHGIAIIEDAAEAHGAEYLSQRCTTTPRWRRCGSIGTASCFSFYANKLITTGEGGMVVTNDSHLADRLRSLRNLCFRPARRFSHDELGFNFRFTNMQAALGVAQLERMDQILEKKRWIGHEYTKRLEGIPGLQLPVQESWARSVYWMYGVVVSEKTGRDAAGLAQQLADRGVETRPFFLGMHEQPVLQRRGLFRDERYPVAERLAKQGLYLPSGLALTEEQLGTVVQAVRESLSQ